KDISEVLTECFNQEKMGRAQMLFNKLRDDKVRIMSLVDVLMTSCDRGDQVNIKTEFLDKIAKPGMMDYIFGNALYHADKLSSKEISNNIIELSQKHPLGLSEGIFKTFSLRYTQIIHKKLIRALKEKNPKGLDSTLGLVTEGGRVMILRMDDDKGESPMKLIISQGTEAIYKILKDKCPNILPEVLANLTANSDSERSSMIFDLHTPINEGNNLEELNHLFSQALYIISLNGNRCAMRNILTAVEQGDSNLLHKPLITAIENFHVRVADDLIGHIEADEALGNEYKNKIYQTQSSSVILAIAALFNDKAKVREILSNLPTPFEQGMEESLKFSLMYFVMTKSADFAVEVINAIPKNKITELLIGGRSHLFITMARTGSDEMVRTVLEKVSKSDQLKLVKSLNKERNNALIAAVITGNKELAKFLLENHWDNEMLEQINNHQENFLFPAVGSENHDYYDLIELFLSKASNNLKKKVLGQKNINGDTILDIAASSGNGQIVTLLLNTGLLDSHLAEVQKFAKGDALKVITARQKELKDQETEKAAKKKARRVVEDAQPDETPDPEAERQKNEQRLNVIENIIKSKLEEIRLFEKAEEGDKGTDRSKEKLKALREALEKLKLQADEIKSKLGIEEKPQDIDKKPKDAVKADNSERFDQQLSEDDKKLMTLDELYAQREKLISQKKRKKKKGKDFSYLREVINRLDKLIAQELEKNAYLQQDEQNAQVEEAAVQEEDIAQISDAEQAAGGEETENQKLAGELEIIINRKKDAPDILKKVKATEPPIFGEDKEAWVAYRRLLVQRLHNFCLNKGREASAQGSWLPNLNKRQRYELGRSIPYIIFNHCLGDDYSNPYGGSGHGSSANYRQLLKIDAVIDSIEEKGMKLPELMTYVKQLQANGVFKDADDALKTTLANIPNAFDKPKVRTKTKPVSNIDLFIAGLNKEELDKLPKASDGSFNEELLKTDEFKTAFADLIKDCDKNRGLSLQATYGLAIGSVKLVNRSPSPIPTVRTETAAKSLKDDSKGKGGRGD
ncbi:MAG: hypothetical protein O3B09_01685, partial [Proteobacteria bacterium]|nr:hypothetical protein [Pseudomonadota bacterium]